MRILIVLSLLIINMGLFAQEGGSPVSHSGNYVTPSEGGGGSFDGGYISNGDFSNGTTGWTLGSTASLVGGAIYYDNSDGFQYLISQADGDMATSMPASTAVTIEFDISGMSGSPIHVGVYNAAASFDYVAVTEITANGHYSWDFTSPDAGAAIGISIYIWDDNSFYIDNIELHLQ